MESRRTRAQDGYIIVSWFYGHCLFARWQPYMDTSLMILINQVCMSMSGYLRNTWIFKRVYIGFLSFIYCFLWEYLDYCFGVGLVRLQTAILHVHLQLNYVLIICRLPLNIQPIPYYSYEPAFYPACLYRVSMCYESD